MTTLFLVGGLIEHVGGSSRMSQLGNMVRTAPVVAVLFLVPALEPGRHPTAVGLRAQVRAGRGRLRATTSTSIVAVSLLVSLLTLFSVMKIWIGVFWGAPVEHATVVPDGATASRS